MKKESGKPSQLKRFLMTLAATTISIILTFGTTAIVERKKQNAEKREMVMMVMYDMRQTLDGIAQCEQKMRDFFDLQVDLVAHPQRYQQVGFAQLAANTPVLEYPVTTENIFKSSIETINTLGSVLFVQTVSSFYDKRAMYKNNVVSDFMKDAAEAIRLYDSLSSFDATLFLFYGQSLRQAMNEDFEQCKLIMKVSDADLDVFSAEQQRLLDATQSDAEEQESNSFLREMTERMQVLEHAREEGKKAQKQ